MSEEKSRKFRQNRQFLQKEKHQVYFIGGGHARPRQKKISRKLICRV